MNERVAYLNDLLEELHIRGKKFADDKVKSLLRSLSVP